MKGFSALNNGLLVVVALIISRGSPPGVAGV
jgi:hypothetical protein